MKKIKLSILVVLAVFIYPFFASADEASSPLADLHWAGDLRYRGSKYQDGGLDDHFFQQLRFRLGFKKEINENAQVITRLETATGAISGNQKLGDSSDPGMARRSFGIDQAYVDYKFFDQGSAWLGRTANPFWSPNGSQLVFDADLAFEGLALRWTPTWSTSHVFVNLTGFMISENYAGTSDDTDTALVAAEAGYSFKPEGWNWTTHVASYQYLNIEGKTISTAAKSAGVDSQSNPATYLGNSVINDGTNYRFAHQYELVEFGTQLTRAMGCGDYGVYFDGVQNTKVGKFNLGFEAGLTGKWNKTSVTLAYVLKQKDAVVAAFTDSDTSGGGTDNRGYKLAVSTEVAKNTTLALTAFSAERSMDSTKRAFSGGLLDAMFNF